MDDIDYSASVSLARLAFEDARQHLANSGEGLVLIGRARTSRAEGLDEVGSELAGWAEAEGLVLVHRYVLLGECYEVQYALSTSPGLDPGHWERLLARAPGLTLDTVNLRVSVGVLRRHVEFMQSLSAERPQLGWLSRIASIEIPDGEQGDKALPVASEIMPVFLLLVSLEPFISLLPPVHRAAATAHLARAIPENESGVQKCLSTGYECYVFCCLVDAGYDPEFIEESAVQSPDIIIRSERILIECKDSYSAAATRSKTESAVAAVHGLIRKAAAQLESFDPEGEFLQVICVDLPEELSTILMGLVEPGRERLMRKLLGVTTEISKCGTLTQRFDLPSPERVLLSDVCLLVHSSRLPGTMPPRAQWIDPSCFRFDPCPRLKSFMSRFFGAMQGDGTI